MNEEFQKKVGAWADENGYKGEPMTKKLPAYLEKYPSAGNPFAGTESDSNNKKSKSEHPEDKSSNDLAPQVPENKITHESLSGMSYNQALLSFEDSKTKLKHEEAGVYDEKGNKIFEKVGGRASVRFTYEESLRMKGMYITHNHPSNDSILSPADVASWASKGYKSIRMIDASGQRMSVVAKDNSQRYDFYVEYNKLFAEANEYAKQELSKTEKNNLDKGEYPGIKRKTRYYQDYKVYNDSVKSYIINNINNISDKYYVKVYFE